MEGYNSLLRTYLSYNFYTNHFRSWSSVSLIEIVEASFDVEDNYSHTELNSEDFLSINLSNLQNSLYEDLMASVLQARQINDKATWLYAPTKLAYSSFKQSINNPLLKELLKSFTEKVR